MDEPPDGEAGLIYLLGRRWQQALTKWATGFRKGEKFLREGLAPSKIADEGASDRSSSGRASDEEPLP